MIGTSRILLGFFSIAFPLALSPNLVSQTKSADSFDAPLQKKVLDFGPSPYSRGGKVRVKLSCYFYPTLMVKEYDEGEEGAEWLAIVPASKGAVPTCTKHAAAGERRIDSGEWCGYFKGTKGNLVFMDAADGANGGLPFVVYDSTTGKKIFEDSAYDSRMWSGKAEDSPFNRLRISSARDGRTLLRYLRVVATDCDLHLEKTSCWERTKKNLDLKGVELPVCSGYKATSGRVASALAYPVEVFLLPQPTIKVIAGAVRCWPVD
jgi:hypothetical protein